MLSNHIKRLWRRELDNFFSMIFYLALLGTAVYLVRFLIYRKKDKKSEKTTKAKKYAIIFAVAMIISFIGYGSTAEDDADSTASSSSTTSKVSSKESSSSEKSSETKPKASSSSSSSQASSSSSENNNPDSYNTGITYDQIARTPDQFKKQKMSFTGRVIQVTEDGDAELRIAVDGNYDNVIYVFVDKKLINKSRILEDDLVTVSGKSKGTLSYESTGNGKITVPAMDAKIINDQGKASDDYGE